MSDPTFNEFVKTLSELELMKILQANIGDDTGFFTAVLEELKSRKPQKKDE